MSKYIPTQWLLGSLSDTGATSSVIGHQQALRYCKFSAQPYRPQPSNRVFRFGNGSQLSLGTLRVRIPPTGTFIERYVDVVAADIPVLLGLDLMQAEGFVIDLRKHELAVPAQGWKLSLAHKLGRAISLLNGNHPAFFLRPTSFAISICTSSTPVLKNCSSLSNVRNHRKPPLQRGNSKRISGEHAQRVIPSQCAAQDSKCPCQISTWSSTESWHWTSCTLKTSPYCMLSIPPLGLETPPLSAAKLWKTCGAFSWNVGQQFTLDFRTSCGSSKEVHSRPSAGRT